MSGDDSMHLLCYKQCGSGGPRRPRPRSRFFETKTELGLECLELPLVNDIDEACCRWPCHGTDVSVYTVALHMHVAKHAYRSSMLCNDAFAPAARSTPDTPTHKQENSRRSAEKGI